MSVGIKLPSKSRHVTHTNDRSMMQQHWKEGIVRITTARQHHEINARRLLCPETMLATVSILPCRAAIILRRAYKKAPQPSQLMCVPVVVYIPSVEKRLSEYIATVSARNIRDRCLRPYNSSRNHSNTCILYYPTCC